MNILISVLIPTYNPNKLNLIRTLNALKFQTLKTNIWELIIIDNCSSDKEYIYSFDISWHTNAKIIRENNIGLTNARVAGINESKGEYIVFVDDDNILEKDYLKNICIIFSQYKNMGAIGGKSIPDYETKPEPWFYKTGIRLGCRDFGDETYIYTSDDFKKERTYPEKAPIGAGMCLRRCSAVEYVNSLDNSDNILDRTGNVLSSGGDCDINLTLLSKGWSVGYFPNLKLFHIIPSKRLTKLYLSELSYSSSKSWIQVLKKHKICKLKEISAFMILPRKIKAMFTYKPWKNELSYIRWKGACGIFDGQIKIK